MMLAHRKPLLLLPALKLPAGLLTPDRLPSPVLAFVVACSLLLCGLTADRIARVDHDYQPALESTRQLAASLDAARALLESRHPGDLDSRLDQADSLADRFHRLATATPLGTESRAQMLTYAADFGDYYVAARRAAAGLSMSAEPDGSSAEDAALGYALLREALTEGIDAQTQAISAARPATAPVELAAWITLGLLAGAVLLRRAALLSADWPVAAHPMARGEVLTIAPAADRGQIVPLREAVERLARQRLAASIAAAKVAKRNNERQIEIARAWSAPALTLVPTDAPRVGMDVYEDEQVSDEPGFGGLALVTG